MRVIFLDIDGVLNSETFCRTLEDQHRQLGHTEPACPKRETTCSCFLIENQIDRAAVSRLNRLVSETESQIVISSSWRKLFAVSDLHQILIRHGLAAEIIGATPDGHREPGMRDIFGPIARIFRGHEIDFWLRQHPEVKHFVILDDDSDMEMHKNRLIQTDPAHGLLDVDVDLAISMIAYDPSSDAST